MSDLSQIRRLQAVFAQRMDDQNIDGIIALFTPDARVENPNGVYQGEAKLREWLGGNFGNQPASRMTQHHLANAVLTVHENGETAEGRTDLFLFRSLDSTPWELDVVTRHHDRFAKVNGEWYFKDKSIEIRGGFKRVSNPVPNAVSID